MKHIFFLQLDPKSLLIVNIYIESFIYSKISYVRERYPILYLKRQIVDFFVSFKRSSYSFISFFFINVKSLQVFSLGFLSLDSLLINSVVVRISLF